MNTDKVVASPKKVVEGIQEVFEGVAHMLDGIIGQLEELESQDVSETTGEKLYAFDEVAMSVPADTSGKKPVAKRQRKMPEKKAKPVKAAENLIADGAVEPPMTDKSAGAANAMEASGVMEAVGVSETSDLSEMSDVTEKTEEAADNPDVSGEDSVADTPPWEPPKDTGQRTEQDTGRTVKKPASLNTAPASSITKDDITAVIVAKIKQNRSNNEKIGKLLSAYGVKALSELPDTKYEAFLTDISQI